MFAHSAEPPPPLPAAVLASKVTLRSTVNAAAKTAPPRPLPEEFAANVEFVTVSDPPAL